MNIEIQKPELERMVREEIQNGRFNSVDELLLEAIQALREKNRNRPNAVVSTQAESEDVAGRPKERKSLAQLFAESPFKRLDPKFERDPDTGRPVSL